MYVVTADGNGFTSRSTISEYMYRRAAELCPGGFDLVDSDTSTRSSLATFDGGKTYTTINKPSGALAIQCRAPERPEVAPKPTVRHPERRVVRGQRPIYCTMSAADRDVGMCSLVEALCESVYESMTNAGSSYTACTPAKAAACFNAVRVLSDDRITVCAPSISDCEAQLDAFKRNPDYTVSADECGVYRVVPGASSQPSAIVDPFGSDH